MKKIILLVMTLLSASFMPTAAYADEFEDEVAGLLATSNIMDPMIKMLDHMLVSMSPSMVKQLLAAFEKEGKDISQSDAEEVIEQYRVRVLDRFREEMTPLVVSEYRKFFTLEEVKAVHKLMQRPEYQVFLEKLPEVMESAQNAGQVLGRKIGQEVMIDLLRNNPKFN